MELQIIYKRTQTGTIQRWQIITKNNTFWTVEGLVGGKLTTSTPTIVEGKNIGKINATTDEEQAIKEAESRYKMKLEHGYFEDINKIDNKSKFFITMLAHKYIDYKDTLSFPLIVSPKIDGCRMVARKDGLWTRNGKKYVSCPHIEKILKPLFEKHPNWIIDGEVYSHNVNFEKVISLVKKTKPTKEDLIESEKLVQYWIFDGVIDDPTTNFKERFKTIKSELKTMIGKNKNLEFVETKEVNSHNEIEKSHDEYVAKGFEGAIIRVINSKYENKRSKNLLKFKKFFDEEFEIVNVLEGLGGRSGMAGKLVLKTKDNKTFGAGIRGDFEYYKELLKNKNKLVGKLATIRYQNLSEEGIPRFPIAINIAPIDR